MTTHTMTEAKNDICALIREAEKEEVQEKVMLETLEEVMEVLERSRDRVQPVLDYLRDK